MLFFLSACSPSWEEEPYAVYYIDGEKALGYSVGEGAYIRRISEPMKISSNSNYISIYACPYSTCAFYYIDKNKDHQFAEPNEFIYGPFTEASFTNLIKKLGLPKLSSD
ncbi:hypothetical protein G3R49_13895 [Shewanella sp. WXL01]|nr:hypothetical protein [Shewanella sp. WXL01]